MDYSKEELISTISPMFIHDIINIIADYIYYDGIDEEAEYNEMRNELALQNSYYGNDLYCDIWIIDDFFIANVTVVFKSISIWFT